MKTILISISLGLGCLMVAAQDVVPISKAEVLKKVSEQNIAIKIADQDYEMSKADYKKSNALFVPSISISHSGMMTNNPLMAFGAKLNQAVLTQEDFNPALLNDPDRTDNYTTKIEFQQSVFNMDGIYQRKAAKLTMDATALQAIRQNEYISFEVEKAYMQLQLAYSVVEVLLKAQEAALANEQLAKNSFKQGYIQYADVLAVSVRVTEVKNLVQQANSHIQNTSDYLGFLMNDYQGKLLKPRDELALTDFSNIEKELPVGRADLKAMQLASKAYKTMNTAEKSTFLPRLNVFGSYELYDDQLFKGDANGYMIVGQLSWNILDGTRRNANVQKSRAALEKAELGYAEYVSKSELELSKSKRMLKDAKNKLVLTQLALEQSKESLMIRRNRFKEGLEKSSDLLISETQYAQKQLAYKQTIFEYNYAMAYLQFLTKE